MLHTATDRAHPNSSDPSLNRVKNLPGYTTPVFKGKDEQRALVEIDVASKVSYSLYPFNTTPF